MQPAIACPGPNSLQQLLLSRTSDADSAALERHVVGCPACFQLLARMAGEKDAGQAAHHPVVVRLAEKIRQAKSPAVAPAMLNTCAASMTYSEPSLQPADESANALGPPQGPGEMGRLGGYRILKILGVGGMGTVYEAEDLSLRRRVALKTMKPAAAAQAGARDRFLREARAAAALSHDHIVPIFQVGEERGVPFLAMPLLHGEMLEDRLKRVGRLPVDEALRIGREIAEGLTAAHDHGIVHRDIKPANIWLESPNSRVKIVDFGLACGQEGDVQLTTPGAILGTPAYMAPEQAGGPTDHRADLFSLGCVLYRMAAGRLPFAGSTPLEILRNIAVQQPRSARELNPEIPTALDQFLLRLLAKEREQRPVSAAVVVKVLRTLEQQLSGTILMPAMKPPQAVPLAPGAKPAGPSPVAQLIQQGPNAAAPAAQLISSATPPAAQAPKEIQNTPSAAGGSLILRLSNLKSVLLAPGSSRKWIMVGAAAGAAVLLLFGLLLIAALLWRGGSQPGGSQVAVKDAGSGPDGRQPHIPGIADPVAYPPPPPFGVKIAGGDPLHPNTSIVMRPAKIEGVVTWDLISDHIIKTPRALGFASDPVTGEWSLSVGPENWDFKYGVRHPSPYAGLVVSALAPDLKRRAVIAGSSVALYEKDNPTPVVSLPTSFAVSTVAWSHAGDCIATYGGDGLLFWDAKKAQDFSRWTDSPTASNTTGYLTWCPDDRSVIAWQQPGNAVYQVEAATGKLLHTVAVGTIGGVNLHPKGEVFALSDKDDGKIKVYDLKGGAPLHIFPDPAAGSPAWSVEGKLLAFSVAGAIEVWNCEAWTDVKLVLKLDKKQQSRSVAIAPGGETLFSCDDDGKIRLWELPSGQQRGTIVFLDTGGWLAVTPEGDYSMSPGADEGDSPLFRFQVYDGETTRDVFPKDFAKKYKANDATKPLQLLR